MSSQWNPRRRAFEKGIYILALLFQKKKKEKKRDSGTGTTLTGTGTTQAKRGSSLLVPVPHLVVLVPPGEFEPN